MDTMTIAQVASQAGDPNATLRGVGHFPVKVQTSTGKSRSVTGATFDGGLALHTASGDRTYTVRDVASAAGNSGADMATYGAVPVTVRTRGGKVRPVAGAYFDHDNAAIVLVTGK